jgi:hypothetical protein
VLRLLIFTLVGLLASWTLLAVLAARLPPGVLRDLAGFLPGSLEAAFSAEQVFAARER